MRWPWQRRHEDVDEAGSQVPAPVQAPRGQWRGLEPMQPVATGDPSAAEPLQFVRTLATRWQVPPALEPLGHEVSITAPAGHVPVAGAPVTGYPDPPELVWAAVPAAITDDPERAPQRRPPARAEQTDPVTAGALAGHLSAGDELARVAPRRPVPAEPVPPGNVRAIDLVGDRDPLPARRSRGVDARDTDSAAASGPVVDVVAPLLDATLTLPVRRAEPRPDPVEAERPADPHVLEPADDPRPGPALDAPTPEPTQARVLPEMLPRTAAERATADDRGAPVIAPRLVVPDAPEVAARPVRPVVGRRSALVAARPSLRAADHAAPAGQHEWREPEPVVEQSPAPGLGVPDWFSSGAVRPKAAEQVVPEPRASRSDGPTADALAARRPPAARGADVAAPGNAGRSVEAAVVPVTSRGPRRVPWPLEAEVGEPEDDAPDEDDLDAPDPVHEKVDDEASADEDAGHPEAGLDVAPDLVLRRPLAEDAGRREPSLRRAEVPDPAAPAPRRFRVGAPLPRPAAAPPRVVTAPSGLADLAVAAMAASTTPADGTPSVHRRSVPSDADDPADLAHRRVGLLPADLGLPDAVDVPAAAAPSVPGQDDLDDDVDDSAPSVDELYEQVRVRLRHELMVDRERAALLAD